MLASYIKLFAEFLNLVYLTFMQNIVSSYSEYKVNTTPELSSTIYGDIASLFIGGPKTG
jgi:hypothetical protein